MIIKEKAYPRAGLIGNPSDCYFGKTISFTFINFFAEITLYETPKLEILPNEKDHSKFHDIHKLAEDVNLYGYYGGIRLLKAAIKVFYDYCNQNKIAIINKNFTIKYYSNIPHRVGLAGSSAIITACFKALLKFYNIKIPNPVLANLILSVEKDELGIYAGLQDRVIQVYQGLVYMDFNEDILKKTGYGYYEKLDYSLLPPLFIAYRLDLAEGSEVVHNSMKKKYDSDDKDIKSAVEKWKNLTEQFKAFLYKKDRKKLSELINQNFDIRRSIANITKKNLEMIDTARSTGASAKFTGSGGAIIGTYKNEKMFNDLKKKLKVLNINIIHPTII